MPPKLHDITNNTQKTIESLFEKAEKIRTSTSSIPTLSINCKNWS